MRLEVRVSDVHALPALIHQWRRWRDLVSEYSSETKSGKKKTSKAKGKKPGKGKKGKAKHDDDELGEKVKVGLRWRPCVGGEEVLHIVEVLVPEEQEEEVGGDGQDGQDGRAGRAGQVVEVGLQHAVEVERYCQEHVDLMYDAGVVVEIGLVVEVEAEEEQEEEEQQHKLEVMATAHCSLLPLLQGDLSLNEAVPCALRVEPTAEMQSVEIPEFPSVASLGMHVQLAQPLVDEDDVERCVEVTLKVDALEAVPLEWTKVPAPPVVEVEEEVKGKGKKGKGKAKKKKGKKGKAEEEAPPPEPAFDLRLELPAEHQSGAVEQRGSVVGVAPPPAEEEHSAAEDEEVVKEAPQEPPRIEWSVSRSFFLLPATAARWLDGIRNGIPVTVTRTLPPPPKPDEEQATGDDEDAPAPVQAPPVEYVHFTLQLADAVSPDATSADGQFPVESVEETTLEAFHAQGTALSASFSSTRPLVPSHRPTRRTLRDVVPERPATPPAARTPETANDARVSSIVELVAQHTTQLREEGDEYMPTDTAEDRHRLLLFRLNDTGQYQTFKEELKPGLVALARELLARRRGDGESVPLSMAELSEQERTDLLQDVYEHALERFTTLINKNTSVVPPPPKDDASLPLTAAPGSRFPYVLAQVQPLYLSQLFSECELEGDLDTAEQVLFDQLAWATVQYRRASADRTLSDDEVAATRDGIADAERELAEFFLRNHSAEAAETHARAALSWSPSTRRLALLACILIGAGHSDDAEVLLRDAQDRAPASPLLSALRAIGWQSAGDERIARRHWDTADSCWSDESRDADADTFLADDVDPSELTSARELAAAYLLPLHLPRLFALAVDVPSLPASKQAELATQDERYDDAVQLLEAHIEAAESDMFVLDELAQLAATLVQAGNHERALQVLERYFAWEPDNPDAKACIYMATHLGDDVETARDLFLRSCARTGETAVALLGAAWCSLKLEQYEQCTTALQLASEINPYHPDVWGLYALACLRQGEVDEFATAWEQCVRLGLRDARLWSLIAQELSLYGQYEQAKEAYRLCMACDPDASEQEELRRVMQGVP